MSNIISVNILDDKLLIKIFDQLNISDQMKCASVSKHWNKLINSIKFEEFIIYHTSPPKSLDSKYVLVKTNSAFSELMNSSKLIDLKKLKININNQIIVEPLIDLSICPDLEHLEINNLTSNQKMYDMMTNQRLQLTSLRHLNVFRVDLTRVFDFFPNLTHIKAVFVEKINYAFELTAGCKLEYLEQNHFTPVDRNIIEFLVNNCKAIEYLTLTVTSLAKITELVNNFQNLKDINFNISNDCLKFCFKYKQQILKSIGKRDITFRINGLRVKQKDTQISKFKIDPDEVFLITYRDLQASNEFTDLSKEDLEFYYNNFKEIEITEKTLHVLKPLFVYDLIMKRCRKMTYHWSNRNSSNYFIDKFFPKLPNIEHLFIASVDGLTNEQLDKLPKLFPKLSNIELHAYYNNLENFHHLQVLVIQSNGFITSCLHNVIKDIKYLSSIEIDPSYDEIVQYIEDKSNEYIELRCHLHSFSSQLKREPILINNICHDRHTWLDGIIFEEFNAHNYEI